ncbi:MAG: permease [Spirochaetaceae bacterium]|nr:MAG: permease [Spirochaetaceae bacterium]
MRLIRILLRYRAAIIAVLATAVFLALYPVYLPRVASSLRLQALTMLMVIPPIFILMGLLDVWVPKETMIQYMGQAAGIKGPLLAFLLGSAAAGPLYGAFPIAAILMKKGASFLNVLIFIGAWSTTKIPMLLFEMKALGLRFALSRLAIDLIGIVVIAATLRAFVPQREVSRIYQAAESIDDPLPHGGKKNG